MTKHTSALKNNKEQGQVLILALVFTAIMLSMSAALVGYSTIQLKAGRTDYLQSQALDLAEAGVDQAIYKLNQDSSYTGETNTALGAGVFTIAVTTIDSNNKQIAVTANIPNSSNPIETKVVKAVAVINAVNVSFNSGVQVGAGGLTMQNNAKVNGNVYSNGDISGSNGSTITGTAIVAAGVAPDPDQQWTTQNTDFLFGNISARADVAQSFIAGTSDSLNKVSLYLKKVGSPNDLTIQLMSDNAGSPSKTVLATGTVTASTVTGSYGWIDGSFNTLPSLNSGTKYWVMLIANVSASNYFSWGLDNNDGYGANTGKYSTSWDAHTPVWTAAGGDFDFETYMGGTVTSLNGVTVNNDAYAHNMTNCTILGNAYYQGVNSCTVGGTQNHPTPDQAPQVMPISAAQITDWENISAAGGVIAGPYTVSGTVTLGPKEINGNLTVNGTLNLTGPVWVKGNITFSNNSALAIDAGLGNTGAVLLADNPANLSGSGIISISNGVTFSGNGNSGSFPLVLTTSTNNSAAIDLSNNAIGAVFYAAAGTIDVSNNVNADQLTGYSILLSNNAIITYVNGLANANFANGPGGSWIYSAGTYVIAK